MSTIRNRLRTITLRTRARAIEGELPARRKTRGGRGAGSRGAARPVAHALYERRELVVLVGGAPGTGKSTTARALAGATGYALLTSDEVRKDLAGISHEKHASRSWGRASTKRR